MRCATPTAMKDGCADINDGIFFIHLLFLFVPTFAYF